LCLVLFVLLASFVHSQRQCTEDAKRLTHLVSNITQHVAESVENEQRGLQLFNSNTTEARRLLEKEVVKAANAVRSAKTYIDHIAMRILETETLIAKYEEENANIKISSVELLEQCERKEKLYETKEKEITEQIVFLRALTGFVQNSNSLDQQMLLEQIIQLLFTLKPSEPSFSNSNTNALIESDFDELQSLLQTKFVSSVSQMGAVLEKFVGSLESRLKQNEIAKQNEVMDCKDEFNNLNFKTSQNENKTIEAQQNLKSLTTKDEQNQQRLKVLENEFDIINKAYQHKSQILSQVSEMSMSSQSSLQSQLQQLRNLLQQPLCCMCN